MFMRVYVLDIASTGAAAVTLDGPYHVEKSQTLPMTCSFSAVPTGALLNWYKLTKPNKCSHSQACKIYYYEFGFSGNFDNGYDNIFTATIQGNKSAKLSLKSAAIEDEGSYQCQLTTPSSQSDSKMLYVQGNIYHLNNMR